MKKLLFLTIATLFVVSFIGYSSVDECFGPAINEFKITIPSDYDHDTWLAAFAEKTNGLSDTYCYSDGLTDENFSKVSYKLIPGKTYIVKIFPILQTVSTEDCIDFLKKTKALLVGAQGLLLVYDLKKDVFPINKQILSFDEKNVLWQDTDGNHRVPYVYHGSDGTSDFRLGYFGSEWFGHCLLCVCD